MKFQKIGNVMSLEQFKIFHMYESPGKGFHLKSKLLFILIFWPLKPHPLHFTHTPNINLTFGLAKIYLMANLNGWTLLALTKCGCNFLKVENKSA